MNRVENVQAGLLDDTVFMAIAHDLKVPLATIRSVVLDSDKSQDTTEQEYNLIAGQAQQAIEMVEDMLSVYRLSQSQSKLPLSPVSINTEIRRVAASAKKADILNSKRLKVKCPPKNKIGLAIADQYLLRRSLANLVNNSLKYSDPRTKVVARVFADKDNISCRVADNGPKIMAPDEAALRGEMVVNSTKRSAGSSGLGLYLTGSMVKLMNGKIDIESGKSGNFITLSFPKVVQQTLFEAA